MSWEAGGSGREMTLTGPGVVIWKVRAPVQSLTSPEHQHPSPFCWTRLHSLSLVRLVAVGFFPVLGQSPSIQLHEAVSFSLRMQLSFCYLVPSHFTTFDVNRKIERGPAALSFAFPPEGSPRRTTTHPRPSGQRAAQHRHELGRRRAKSHCSRSSRLTVPLLRLECKPPRRLSFRCLLHSCDAN